MSVLREELKKYGAQDSHFTAKVMESVEDMFAEMTPEEAKQLGSKIRNEELREMQQFLSYAHDQKCELQFWIEKAQSVGAGMNDENRQAANLFKATLEATKDVFGDNIPTEVMVAAINAGSYGMWRSIMGESKPLVGKI